MSRENVELARSIFESWGRGDFDHVPWAHPDIVAVIADGPAPVETHGLAGMAEGWRELLRAWEGFRAVAERCVAVGDDRVLVLTRFSGRGKLSGVDIEQVHTRGANVLTIRDGRVVRAVHYFDRDRALADLGLAKEPG